MLSMLILMHGAEVAGRAKKALQETGKDTYTTDEVMEIITEVVQEATVEFIQQENKARAKHEELQAQKQSAPDLETKPESEE